MPLKLIIGRSNSGKSKLMYEDIKNSEKIGRKCVVFVPDFARIVAEQEYFKYTQNSGMINTKITTLKRFSEQNVENKKLYENKEFLPEISKKYIIKKCIIDNADKLKIFNKVGNTQGFAEKLYKFVTIFESENLDKEKVKSLISKEDFLSKKFKEIYDLYEIIESITSERFVTSIDVLDFFINQTLEKTSMDINTNYFFDYYNNFNEKELNYIVALLKNKCSVTITLDLDIQNKDLSDIFDIPYDTYKKLICLTREIGCSVDEVALRTTDEKRDSLNALQNNIFILGAPKSEVADDSVQIKLLKNPYDEIEYIAQDIITHIKEKKYRYCDFKIYYNNPDMYDINIKRIFKEYGIPVYISGECSGNSDTIIVFLRSVMEQLKVGFAGINIDNIIQILKTGLFDFNEKEIYTFENYVREFGIKLYDFTKVFEKNNKGSNTQLFVYDLEKINEIREYIYTFITNLKCSMEKSQDTKYMSGALYECIKNSEILKMYEIQLNEIKEYDIDEFNKKKQVIQKVYDIMDNISIAFDKLNLDTYVELFEYGLEDITLKSIPPFIDQVEVCNIDSTRSLARKIVYVIGVYENGLPIISNTESVFSDKEILELDELGIQVAKTSETRNNMALFNVYKAINSCSEKLTFTLPSSKLTGENLRMSPVIWRIKDILDVEVDGNIYTDNNFKELSIKNVYGQFVKNLAKKSNDNLDELKVEYNVLMENDKYSSVLNYKIESDKLSKETVEKIYGKEILSSVSRLERYSACPFNYFTTYVLKLKERKEYKLSQLDLGSIMHKVLEDFSKFLLQNNKGFEDIVSDEMTYKMTERQVDKSIDSIFEDMYIKYESSAKYAYLKTRLKKGMLNVLTYISKSFMQSEFRPLGFEVEFDNDKLFAPIEVNLSNGQKMYLRGKIDRVDAAKLKEVVYLRVVDYKSSGKDLKLSDVKEGVSLQLMSYMAALLENSEKISTDKQVLPAAVSYFTLNTDLLNLSECVSSDKVSEKLIEKMKMKGIYLNDVEVLKKLDNKFSEPSLSYIEMTTRKLSNENKSLTDSKFIEECKNIKEILRRIGDEVVTGHIKPSQKENSCKYCSYAGICKKTL